MLATTARLRCDYGVATVLLRCCHSVTPVPRPTAVELRKIACEARWLLPLLTRGRRGLGRGGPMNSYLANPGPREANTPANRRALRPLTSWPKGTPLPLPLPFKRGEGAASAVLVGTEVQEQGEAMHRPRSGLNSTAVVPRPALWLSSLTPPAAARRRRSA